MAENDPNLPANQQLLEIIQQQGEQIERNNRRFRSQSETVSDIQKIFSKVEDSLDNIFLSSGRTKGALGDMGAIVQGFGQAAEAAGIKADNAVTGFVSGLGKVLTTAGGIMKGVDELAISMTKKYERQVVRPLFDINEQFKSDLGAVGTAAGDFGRNLGRNVGGAFREIGLSANVFGVGMTGIRNRAAFARKALNDAGAAADSLRLNFGKTGAAAFGALTRAGFATSQQVEGLTQRLVALGGDPVKSMREITAFGVHFEKRFGVSSKAISRDISTMMADMANFGNLSVQEMGAAATFARRLGTDISKLQGVIGQFDDFEAAAQATAKLSQAFGANVDAVRMMNAENPAERVSMLRDAMFAAGKSTENMTRQELKLLAAQTGLDAQTARLVFSQKNRFKGEQDLQKQLKSREAREKALKEAPLQMAKSMGVLQRTMTKVFVGIEDLLKSFGEQMMMGPAGRSFMRGFRNLATGSVRNLLQIGQAVNNLEIAKKLGKAFEGASGATRRFLNDVTNATLSLVKIGDKIVAGKIDSISKGQLTKGVSKALDASLKLDGKKRLIAVEASLTAAYALREKLQAAGDTRRLRALDDRLDKEKRKLERAIGEQSLGKILDKVHALPKDKGVGASDVATGVMKVNMEKSSKATGVSAVQALSAGIQEGASEAMKGAAEKASFQLDLNFRKATGMQSPMTMAMPYGVALSEGIASGFVESAPSMANQIGVNLETALQSISSPIGEAAGAASGQLVPVAAAMDSIRKTTAELRADINKILTVDVPRLKADAGAIVGQKEVTVKHGAINLVANVNVSMDAVELTRTIVQTDIADAAGGYNTIASAAGMSIGESGGAGADANAE